MCQHQTIYTIYMHPALYTILKYPSETNLSISLNSELIAFTKSSKSFNNIQTIRWGNPLKVRDAYI